MRITQEKTDWIITEAFDFNGQYRHVLVVHIDDKFRSILKEYQDTAKTLAGIPGIKHLTIEDDSSYLIKSRKKTEDYFPGWEEMASENKWSYLEMDNELFENLREEFEDDYVIQELLVSTDGYFHFQFLQEVDCEEYMYYRSWMLNTDEVT